MKQAAAAGDLLRELPALRGLEPKLREYRAWLIWDQVVGPQIAARARPIRVRDAVLEVRVDQPVWMQQLQLLKPKILARLNERLGEGVLRDIFLRRGAIPPRETPTEPADPFAWKAIPLSPEEQAAIEKVLAPLTDPELQSRLRTILTRQSQLKKAQKG
jgi:hypothetical protein